MEIRAGRCGWAAALGLAALGCRGTGRQDAAWPDAQVLLVPDAGMAASPTGRGYRLIANLSEKYDLSPKTPLSLVPSAPEPVVAQVTPSTT